MTTLNDAARPVELDWPEYQWQGMGCGLEDRGITDRYEACQYGFHEGIARCAEMIQNHWPLYTAADYDALRAENDRLRSLLGEKLNAETVLQELRMKPGELFAEFEGGAAGILIHCLGDMFIESNAPNYLDMRFNYKGEAIAVLIQRVSGLTPAQRVVAAEARAEAAEAKVANANHNDVYTLMGHAEILRMRGEVDMPKYLLELAGRISLVLGDKALSDRCAALNEGGE